MRRVIRITLVVAVIMVVLALASPRAADAARDATVVERASIEALFAQPVECFAATVSTVDEQWAYAASGCPTPEHLCPSGCFDSPDASLFRRGEAGTWSRAVEIYAIDDCAATEAPTLVVLDLDVCVPSSFLLRQLGATHLTRRYATPWRALPRRWLACTWVPRGRTIAGCEFEFRRGDRFVGGSFRVHRTGTAIGASHWRARSYDPAQRACRIAVSTSAFRGITSSDRVLGSSGAIPCKLARSSSLLVPAIDRMAATRFPRRIARRFDLRLPAFSREGFEARTRLRCRTSGAGHAYVVSCSNARSHAFTYSFTARPVDPPR